MFPLPLIQCNQGTEDARRAGPPIFTEHAGGKLMPVIDLDMERPQYNNRWDVPDHVGVPSGRQNEATLNTLK